MILHAATFFTHYDAILYAKSLTQQGIDAKCCPVPRELSSSCGTAVRFFLCEGTDTQPFCTKETEQLCVKQNNKWIIIFDNK